MISFCRACSTKLLASKCQAQRQSRYGVFQQNAVLLAGHTQHLRQGAIVGLITLTMLNVASPLLLQCIPHWADWAADHKHGSGQD